MIELEIKNLNYLDLTKETCPEKVKKLKSREHMINKAPPAAPKAPEDDDKKPSDVLPPAPKADDAGDIVDDLHDAANQVQKDVQDAVGENGSGKPPWTKGKKNAPEPAKQAPPPQPKS